MQDSDLGRKELLEQLERIVTSKHFRSSKRYPSFLRFVVERTVEHNVEVLKERNVGTEVFGRPSDYDTSVDPIVRVAAGEVRKRIAQYYQTAGHEHEIRIDLPPGSYVPHFYAGGNRSAPVAEEKEADVSLQESSADATIAPSDNEELVLPNSRKLVQAPLAGSTRRRRILTFSIVGLLIGIAATLFGVNVTLSRIRNEGINYFWRSFTPADANALIVIGVHFSDASGKALPADPGTAVLKNGQQTALASMVASDMVPVSDVLAYSKITDLLTRRSVAYRTKGSTDTTLDELRRGPIILVGGFNNLWTMRLISSLRYRFVPKTETVNEIQDSQHPSINWTYDNLQPAIANSRDYAIVASYYDTTIEQHVIIAAGIGMNGTVAASEFLTTENDLEKWLANQKLPANKNVELVLSTDVLDGEPGPPHVIAVSVW